MNVLIFNGSPRKKGNTEILLNAVTHGIRKNGGREEIIRLADLAISPCSACGGCDKTGKCIIQDDMIPLYEKIDQAERIVIASPIYFYGVTAQTKIFIDRTQAMWSRKLLSASSKQRDEKPKRKGFFVSVAATRGEKVFVGASLTLRYCFDAIGISFAEELLVKGVDKRGEMAEKTDEIERAKEFGHQIIK